MAISLKKLRSSTSTYPPIVLIYGVDGIGKTSLAAEFPDAIYLPTAGERTPEGVDLATPEDDEGNTKYIESWEDLRSIVGELLTEEHEFKTAIFDALDGLEPFVNAATCARIGADSIGSNDKGSPAAFGQGDVQGDIEWGEFMDACAELTRRGIAVVLLAHPEIKRFDDPVNDPYDRYQVGIRKRAAKLVRERSDIVAFMNSRITLKTKEVGIKKEVTHAEGGRERQIHLTRSGGFDAKNRYAMPDAITYRKGQGYTEMAKYFPAPTGVAA
ncbi:ATP-binding protein [Rhizobium laguerreae]|uniref:ATP-binding protein n=1 Tax=Rhizobium laguerreae TaxID=1076926 RepID=UPI001C91D093|nr:ATP-binding protein [Rhizobium laguerreae]MBY3434863.1 ATP-binding protein [Rhizobium laguerreae]MBY3449005.1 ATP-binding protein [Rhizobium laguerreae]MBY3456779.1 ATP-binding protein [Rhizobium laguerreae]